MDPLLAKVIAAACGSSMTALTMTPFDVVKTRLQTQPPQMGLTTLSSSSSQVCCIPSNTSCVRKMSSLARAAHPQELVCLWDHGTLRAERVDGFSDAFRKVWHAEGVRGLWKGVGTTLLIGVPSSTCYMLTYDHLVHVLIPTISPSPSVTPLISGVLARSAISSVASPFELLRTNLQSTPLSPDNPHTLSSVFGNIRSLVRSQGVASLWRGLGPTLWRDVPFSGLYWAGYETSKSEFEKRGHRGAQVAFMSGSISGAAAALLTNPFDVLKTRRQALLMGGAAGSTPLTSLSLLSEIIRTEGIPALFAGLAPRMVKIVPACGIMIACYESIGTLLTKPILDEE
ncbi:mitochondrial carrier domain-containing protein [Hysterangium stoloniferum]|nr:mitochondrial carrier domain-containing protein [Hysterangium stoloniferum]